MLTRAASDGREARDPEATLLASNRGGEHRGERCAGRGRGFGRRAARAARRRRRRAARGGALREARGACGRGEMTQGSFERRPVTPGIMRGSVARPSRSGCLEIPDWGPPIPCPLRTWEGAKCAEGVVCNSGSTCRVFNVAIRTVVMFQRAVGPGHGHWRLA